MNIIRIKEMFIIFINLSLRKRQRVYKRASGLQTMETETTLKTKKKKPTTTTLNYFFFLLQSSPLLGPGWIR